MDDPDGPSLTPIFKRKKAKGRESGVRSFGGSAPSTPGLEGAAGGEDDGDDGNVAIIRSKKKSAAGKVKDREKGRSRLSFGGDVRASLCSRARPQADEESQDEDDQVGDDSFSEVKNRRLLRPSSSASLAATKGCVCDSDPLRV